MSASDRVLELSSGSSYQAKSKKKRTKGTEEPGDKLALEATRSSQDQLSARLPPEQIEGTAEAAPEGKPEGIGGVVDDISKKAKTAVRDATESGAERAKDLGEGMAEKGSEPPVRAPRAVVGEAEELPPPPSSDEFPWDEDYEEDIDAEEPPPPKPKKKRHYGAVVITVVVLVVLILWTVFSPAVLPETGGTYVTSDKYANLGNYIGTRDIWAGNMTWGVGMSGPTSTTVGTTINISVVVCKVREKTSSWFFEGTSVRFRNVSFYTEQGICVGTMSNWSNTRIGPVATVPVTLDQPGNYSLYLFMRFMVTMDMRIGFLPLETVQIPQAYLDEQIIVL